MCWSGSLGRVMESFGSDQATRRRPRTTSADHTATLKQRLPAHVLAILLTALVRACMGMNMRLFPRFGIRLTLPLPPFPARPTSRLLSGLPGRHGLAEAPGLLL